MTLAHDHSASSDSTPEMDRLRERIAKVAPTTLPVLLVGETGSGKELFAETLHRKSRRSSAPFVKVNCAALTETLLESELFGHEKGAFAGAHNAHAGLFAAADGGTLFLDEIGELSLRAQAKLLRVLEVGEIMRVGSTMAERVDVRVVSATHRDLRALVAEGRFREDLYFRLKGMTMRIPPLRERRSEILPLAKAFIVVGSRKMDRPAPGLSDRAAAALVDHAWPGNVRELRAAIECALVLCDGDVLDTVDLDLAEESPRATTPPPSVRGEVLGFERARIIAVLAAAGGNQTKAARLLRVSRRTLTNKLSAYGIERPRRRTGSIGA